MSLQGFCPLIPYFTLTQTCLLYSFLYFVCDTAHAIAHIKRSVCGSQKPELRLSGSIQEFDPSSQAPWQAPLLLIHLSSPPPHTHTQAPPSSIPALFFWCNVITGLQLLVSLWNVQKNLVFPQKKLRYFLIQILLPMKPFS